MQTIHVRMYVIRIRGQSANLSHCSIVGNFLIKIYANELLQIELVVIKGKVISLISILLESKG